MGGTEAVKQPLIRSIADTARWVAVYRAQESERADAVFRDPFARRLAGERGAQIAARLPFQSKSSWPFVARTFLVDEFVTKEVGAGADLVVNLAAGLDTRPYRMSLPSTLRWAEVDLPEILDHKEEILSGEKPACALERHRLDLSDVGARRGLFAELGRNSKRAVIITEGLITYLESEKVGALAQDLAAVPAFQHWILDLSSPALLRMLDKRVGRQFREAGVPPFKFAPAEGADFFVPHGWKPVEVRSTLKTGAKLHRLPLLLRLFALLPDTKNSRASKPWSGVCLFRRAS